MFNLLSIMGNPASSQQYSGFYVQDVSGSANTVSIRKNNASAPTLTIETSADGQTWSTLGQTSTTALQIQVPANGKVYVRCNATNWGARSLYNYFNTATGNFKVGGNIMSLIYGSSFTGNETSFPSGSTNTLRQVFFNNNKLTDAGFLVLPATTLSDNCYLSMFERTSIVHAPALPATTLTVGGYSYMFQYCASLIEAPALPVTITAQDCCRGMFRGCTTLTTTPALLATTLAQDCYKNMFYECTGLTTVTSLPATTLAQGCYENMFYGCSSLSNVTCLAENISASNCTNNWLNNVSATGTFYKSPNMSSWTTGVNGIPSGWTVVDA